MPDDTDARAADGKEERSGENLPDLVGEELGDGAHIWRVYDRVARDEDRERIGNWNRGLDNLALFAGLFSAVTTAFIIEAQQDTEPDYARLTFLVLNASATGARFVDEPFTIDPSVRLTNCLWIASLMLSLTAALIAIMGKDWIGMYSSRPVCNPRQWAEIRTYRLMCVERWYMSGVIASAPVLLHISLVLFAAGLVIFVSPDPFSQRLALGLALAAGGLYLVTVLSAVAFPSSPFKSPATQSVRGTAGSLVTSLYDRLLLPPKRRPIALLQQATLIIGGVLSYSLPTDILPLDRSERRRFRRADARAVWNHLFAPSSSGQARSWRDRTTRVFAQIVSIRSTLSASALLRSALEAYHYRLQRPHTRPWHSPAQSYLRRTVLSDRWAEVRDAPSPDLLAQSLSHLNEMTQAPDVFRAILIALGDIAIGREVAPLVSLNLKSRLASEIRHNWLKADLVTLSRYTLADVHLSDTPLIPPRVVDRFSGGENAIKSESIFFALVELSGSVYFSGTTMNSYCPDIVIQPRGLRYLLPRVEQYHIVLVLAQRYWRHLGTDESLDLESELRRRLESWAWDGIEAKLKRRFGASVGILELLVASLDYIPTDIVTNVCALILEIISARYLVTAQACLVYAFGHQASWVADAAWTALPAYHPSALVDYFGFLELSLPLERLAARRCGVGITPPLSEEHRVFETCLARAMVRLLSPSRYFSNCVRPTPKGSDGYSNLSTLEVCVRGLRTQLFHYWSALDRENKLEVITLMLQHSVLIRVCTLWEERFMSNPWPTTERNVINILTAIARRLATLLASGVAEEYNTGARLCCLFSFSEVTDYRGQTVAWDLGSYLRTVAGRLSQQDPSTAISLRRLIRELHALRPLCAARDDLRAAWERVGLAPDNEYHVSFWDADQFDLGPFLFPDAPIAPQEGLSGQDTVPPVLIEDFSAPHWLGVDMR